MVNPLWHDPATIRRILPHREPFLFVDRVVAFEPGKRILAEKDLLSDECFFSGHFPGQPIMPGVLVSEALAQTSGLLLGLTRRHDSGDPDPKAMEHLFLTNVNMKYPSTAEPGETLMLKSELRKSYGRMFLFQVSASAGNRKIAAGTLSLAAKPSQ
jgi:3-hydroxyacyl-[acyl-carrier-protein] dehydratase